MDADLLVTDISELATAPGNGAVYGPEMNHVEVITDAAFAVTGDRITWVGKRTEWSGHARRTVEALGRAVTPALIDPHTHAVWGGDRLDDFELYSMGVNYEKIARRGGGIHSTIKQTRSKSPIELAALALPRIAALMRGGAATIEVKSGYGGWYDSEMRSLEAIALLKKQTRARLVSTLLIHVPPEEPRHREDFLEMVVKKLIPDVAARRLATAVDVFVERQAFTSDEAVPILDSAKRHGLGIKVHADQFCISGGVRVATEAGALSVDHLEAIDDEDIKLIAKTRTVATILPAVTLQIAIPAAPGRMLVEGGAAVAVATDLNPGSSPIFSPQLAMALSVRINNLTPCEAFTAGTANAAAALALTDAGRIAPGMRADFLIVDSRDWRDLVYAMGMASIARLYIGGEPCHP